MRVDVAGDADMPEVRRLRHEAYARELGQHAVRDDGELPDPLDAVSTCLVARDADGDLAGFVFLTPPGAGRYSIDKDVAREALPFTVDGGTHEVRLLTVARAHRGSAATPVLMLAALQRVAAEGGDRLVVKGRHDLVGMYERVGLVRSGVVVRSGQVEYELMSATVAQVRERAAAMRRVLLRITEPPIQPPIQPPVEPPVEPPTQPPTQPPTRPSVGCFHGGATWEAVGDGFDDLGRRRDVVPADVLDAWFPPAPGVVRALEEDPEWLLRTSPPADCAGMLRAVSAARGVDVQHLLAGAGSSALVFLALGRWLTPASRVLLLDPTYGEYAHVLERVIGAQVDRFSLRRDQGWDVDPAQLVQVARRGLHDLVVVVNPNSPTGRHVPREQLEAVLAAVPTTTRVWVDETYVDHVDPGGPSQSVERFAAASPNVVVVKSLSKAYALSGARAAYLCGPADVVAELRAWTPPWAVSLSAQVAVVRALEDPDHYARCWQQTAVLRAELARGLAGRGLDVVPGVANFLLAHLPGAAPTAAEVVARCRQDGIYLRDAGGMGSSLGDRSIRVAVRSAADNARVLDALRVALQH